MGSIATLAVLTRLHISDWRGRATDKTAAEGVEAAAKAKAGTTSVHKALVRPEALSDVRAAANRAREAHQRLTLPWTDDGQRLLPAAKVDEYQTRLEKLRGEYATAVGTFLASYPQEQALQAVALGALYDPADYPSAADMAARFALDWEISAVPSAADIRVDLDPRTRDQIAGDLERRERERTLAASLSLRDDLQRACQDVLDMLSYRKPTQACLDRLATACDRASELNILDIPEIAMILPVVRPIGTGDRDRWEIEQVKRSDAALLTMAIQQLEKVQ